jgi:CRP-like cAMP-binding protein
LLDREEFLRLINDAPAMQAGLASIAKERLQEHEEHKVEECR